MKKIVLALLALSLVVMPLAVLAFDVPEEPGDMNIDVQGLVESLVSKVWYVFAGFAVIMFVYAGVLFLTAAGAAEKVQAARQAALWGVVGVVVMILAFSIFNIAASLFT